MRYLGYYLLGLVAVVFLGWGLTYNDFAMYRYFAPKQEAVRRQVFEQTKSYNQGMIQELQNMQFQYEQADPKHRAALADLILHRSADYNVDLLPPDLRSFIAELRRERMAR